jgi:hypothetical protein
MSERSLLLLSSAFILAAGVWAAPSRSLAQAIPLGGCLAPSEAALLFIGDDFFEPTLPDGSKLCERQCRQLLRGCEGAIAAAVRCTKAAFGSQLKAAALACKEEPSKAEEKACKDEVRAGREGLADGISASAGTGKAACAEELPDCIEDCADAPPGA